MKISDSLSLRKTTLFLPAASLLSLVPLSYIVAPISDLGNKFTFFSSNMHLLQTFELPTVLPSDNAGIDIFVGIIPDNYDKVRNKTLLTKAQASRDSSMSSTKSFVMYYEKIEHNNAMNEDINIDDNSLALSYETFQKKAIQVSKAVDPQTNTLNQCSNLNTPILNSQHVSVKHSILNSTYVQIMYLSNNMVINIQLLYDPNALTEPELWDGNFYPISLHGSIEHLASDSKNIKDSLNFIAKYISNKQADSSKFNDFKDFHGIGKAVWNFISSIYQTNWDSLYADKHSNTLRKKIAAKFTPKIQPITNKSNKVIDKLTPANIEKIPPLFPPNTRRKLIKSPNTSRTSNWLTLLNSLKNLTLRL